MHVVSSNTPTDIAINRASEQIREALIDLAANILRVIRGAGKPEEIDHQALRFVRATIAHQEAAGCLPHPSLYSTALFYDENERGDRRTDQDPQEHYLEERIVRAVLQLVASRMLRQLTHENKSKYEMAIATNDLSDIREAHRRRMHAELRAQAKPVRKKKRRSKKPKPSPVL